MDYYARIPKDAAVQDRFWSKVDRGEADACWPWLNTRTPGGYGQFSYARKRFAAHRVAYTWMREVVPVELVCDHLCRNRACVNPHHIEIVSSGENVRRGIGAKLSRERADKITHCPRGHAYTEQNTRVRGGSRHCVTCNNERATRDRVRARIARAAEFELDDEP